MAIITKPAGGILKGVPASISLSKSELSALSIIVADSYFSNTSNWNKVILKYRSSTGKQYEAVQFDATLSSPTGNFLVSIKARDTFEIQTIEIHDFDNDIFIVPRSALNVADFDVVLLSAPSSLSYSTPVTYTQNTAITNNVPTVTGTVTSYSILPALPAGLSLNTTTGVISGTPTEVSAAANYIVTASNEAGSTTATINITVVESMEEFDIVNFTGRNSSTYISFPAPGSVTRLLPAVNLENNGQGSFWSTTPLSGDFTFIATVKAGSVSDGPVQALFGLNDVMPPPSNSGYGLKAAGWGLNFYNDGSVVRPWDVGVDTLAYTKGSTYNIEIKRVSGVVSYKVNSTTFSYTLSTSDTVYLVGYLQVGSWEVTNAQLAVPEVPVGDPIMWDLFLNGATTEADGGLIGASIAAYSFTKSNASRIANGADFTITYKFTNLVADWVHGISSVLTEESQSQFNFTGLTYQQSVLISYYRGVRQPDQSLSILNSPGENTLVIEKTGTNLTFTLNNTVVLSKTDYTEQLTVPAVRPWNVRALDSAYVEIQEVSYYLYNQLGTGHTTDAFGAISSSTSLNSQSFNTTALIGDFDVEYTFDAALPSSATDSIFGLKQTLDSTNNYIGFLTVNGFVSTYFSAASQNSLTQASGQNIFRIKRTGSLIDFYLNGVKTLNSHNFSGDLYLVVRANAGFDLISTVDNLGTGSNFAPVVTWNVAGKSGVGTVTTGANGLITKATGGNGYNVNVLSNETITGDGYVEFIYSSIFLNVVFGVAEVNSASGSYDQIIYGTYVAIGAYERVLAGQAIGGAMGTSVNGDVIRIQRTGTTFSILKNGSVIDTVTINNTNPLKVSISIYPSENYGVNNVTISE